MATVRVHMEILSVETGLWCNTCVLPSGVRVWYVTTAGGARMTLRSKRTCDDAQDAGHDGDRHDVVDA